MYRYVHAATFIGCLTDVVEVPSRQKLCSAGAAYWRVDKPIGCSGAGGIEHFISLRHRSPASQVQILVISEEPLKKIIQSDHACTCQHLSSISSS